MIFELCTGDVHELIGLHVVGARLIGVVTIHKANVGYEYVLSVRLLCHCRVMLPMDLLEFTEGNIKGRNCRQLWLSRLR